MKEYISSRATSLSARHVFSTSRIILFALIIVGNACRSHKKLTVADDIVPSQSETMFYTSCYPIESLYIPSCKLDISSGHQSFSLNGSIYIRPDSVCFFRGRLLVEVLRGVIYQDSFLVVNYIERVCYQGKNDYLQKITGYPVNPQSLMMLFTADRCEEVYRSKFNFITADRSDGKLLMQGQNRSLLEMNINAKNSTVEKIALYNNRQQQALFSATYSGYEQFLQFAMPTVFNISAYDGNMPIRIKANFQQVQFNQPQKINISISSSFKVVVLE